jgi:tetratricopeptide (TPR) repeat protein
MEISSPSLQSGAAGTITPSRRWACFEALLSAVLAAHKTGTLDELLHRRPKVTLQFAARLLPPVRAVAGDAIPHDPLHTTAWQLLLRASLARLRPDGAPGLLNIDRQDWTARTSWRPLLALICHYGFVPVQPFADRYRPRPDETAAEHLCGLWNVGPSTFYRYLDKGKRRLAELVFEAPLQGERGLALYALLQDEVYLTLQLNDAPARVAWHARQASAALAARAPLSALWHLMRAGDVAGFIHGLRRFPVELASDARTDALVQRFAGQTIDWRLRFELCLAQAGLSRVRGVEQAEREACDEALRIASTANDKMMLGIVYGAMGKFNEARDTDRAFACYQESVEFLRQAGLPDDPAAAAAEMLEEYVKTLVKLAWLFVLRNDPRCKVNLDRAEALRDYCAQASEVLAMLEQTWGEYWRRSGDLRRALEHKHRALHMYERLGDRQSILKTYGNLSLIYSDAKDFARAIDYSQRVLDMADKFTVEPETVAATHLHLGATYFWQGKYDPAIEHYLKAFEIAQQAKLLVLVGRAHYNLAEAYYKRFQALDDADDERRGDAHTDAALASWPDGGDPAPVEATRKLKHEILGPRDKQFYDRLLPGELAAHYTEMSDVQRHRATLALPLAADERVEAHLAIAQAYLEISVKEREAAVTLIEEQHLGQRFAPQLVRLRETFFREMSREQRLSSLWHQETADLMDSARCAELLQHLLRAGSINKSAYAQLCAVGLATASKHLGKLAERGLLLQTGKGPSTRYLLPR